MAAPKNNQWWKLRTTHGRNKIFKTPEILWDACQEYFEETDKRKWNKVEFKGSQIKKVLVPTETPYTIAGLCLFLGVNSKYFNDFKYALRNKTDKKSLDYSEVIERVEQIIYIQKFEGATVGVFKENIIARDLGLSDKTQLQGDEDKPLVFTTPEEREKRLQQLAAKLIK